MSDQSPPPPVADVQALGRHLRRLATADAAPWLHQETARRMAERLPVIRQAPGDWLQWWGFLGGGHAQVSALWPQARCTVAEPTDALLARSREALRAPWWALGRSPVPVVLARDVPDGQAGMLWANMVLQAMPDVGATLLRWHRALAADGFLMFSTLGPDTLRELREVFSQEGWPEPHPPYPDMHDVGDLMVQAGFADPVMDQEILQLHWSSPEALLAELRSLGGHIGSHRFPGLRTPRWRNQLLAALARRADSHGRISLRFEVVYGHAYKPAPRATRGSTTAIPLETLRNTLPRRPQSQTGET